MKKLLIFIVLLFSSAQGEVKDPLQKLLDGNIRYTKNEPLHPNRDYVRREAIAALQEPYAVIVACSDSRVAPEIIFDQGLGDLFVVRVAGNIVGPVEQDSIDYAVIYLHASVIFVLGHQNCGAIQAVMDGTTKDIESVANIIKPHIEGATNLQNAVEMNVQATVAQLKNSPALSPLINAGTLKIAGGYYNLNSGTISLIE